MSFSDWINEHKGLVLGLVALCFVVLLGTMIVVLKPKPEKQVKTSVTAISFNDGSNEVIVDRSGKVTIKTPFGTYTQFWDKEKIRSFFESLDTMDFDTLVSYVGTEAAISLTGSNGQTIVIDTSLLPEGILVDLQQTLEDTYENEQITVVKATPLPVWYTPRPGGGSSNPTTKPNADNPWHTGTDPVSGSVFRCEAYKVEGARYVIVSQALCGQ